MLGLGLVLGLTLVGRLDVAPASPPAWSPDGRWLAHLSEPVDPSRLLRAGEVLLHETPDDEATPPEHFGPDRRRLWATRIDGGRSVSLLDGLVGAPAWTRDGNAVLAMRGVVESERVVRVELLRVRSDGRSRVVATEVVDLAVADLDRLAAEPPVCSPDGSTALIPRFRPAGLALVKLDDGTVLRHLEGMGFPAWAPDGFRAAMCRRGETASLVVVEPRRGEPRLLVEIGVATRPPVWSGDGRSIFVVSGLSPPKFGDFRPAQGPALLRVSPDTGQADSALGQELDRPMPGVGPAKALSFALDGPGDNLFYCAARLDAPVGVVWFRPRDGFFFKRFPLIDDRFSSEALTLSPSGKRLAARVFGLDRSLSPVLFDLEKSTAAIAAPDDAARAEWITFLARNCRAVIDGHRAGKLRLSPFESRSPSPLPLPAELADNSDEIQRLRRLSKLGLALSRRGEWSEPPPRPLAVAVDEANLMFAYLVGDRAEALAALDRLESTEGSPARNLTLLGIRAQTWLQAGDLEDFEELTAFIERIESRARREVVYLGERPVVTVVPPEKGRWTEALRGARIRLERDDEAPRPERAPPDLDARDPLGRF